MKIDLLESYSNLIRDQISANCTRHKGKLDFRSTATFNAVPFRRVSNVPDANVGTLTEFGIENPFYLRSCTLREDDTEGTRNRKG